MYNDNVADKRNTDPTSALDDKFTVTEQDVDTIAFKPLTTLIMKSQSKSKQRGSLFCPDLKRMVKYIFQVINQKVEPKPYIDHRHTEEPFPERVGNLPYISSSYRQVNV